MTKAEFIERMQRDMDEDTEIRNFAISGRCAKGTVVMQGLQGSMMEITQFVVRMIRTAAKAMGTKPEVMAGAIEMVLRIGGPEDSIEIDMTAAAAATAKETASPAERE